MDNYWCQVGASPDLLKMDIIEPEVVTIPGMLELVENKAPEIILKVHPSQIRRYDTTASVLARMIKEAAVYDTVEGGANHIEVHLAEVEVILSVEIPMLLSRNDQLFFTSRSNQVVPHH